MQNNQETKVCTKCGIEKVFDDFHIDNRAKSGIASACKDCARNYIIENHERKKEYDKKYREENKERLREYNKKYREENRERLLKNIKKHYEENRERLLNYRDQPAKYNTYSAKLIKIGIECKNDSGLLMARCIYCNLWFYPTIKQVKSKISAANNTNKGECNLYCKDECKKECPTFGQRKYPRGHKIDTGREVQPELRKMVFERDDHQCIKCGSDLSLHCHHMEGIELNPVESADIDMCVTFCKSCHKGIHREKGCRNIDLRREQCISEETP